MAFLLDAFFFITAWGHVFLAPFTKVEESFNLHATHDVFMYGVAPSQLQHYDHFDFPGVVPRSFIGSLMLGWTLYPLALAADAIGMLHSKFDLQILARLMLATANAIGLCFIRRSVSRRFGTSAGAMFVGLSCTQFHVPFWMGRTLPNMFAFLPVNIATGLLIDRTTSPAVATNKYLSAVALITCTAVIFRAELALLLPGVVLQGLQSRRVPFGSILQTGVVYGVLSLATTLMVDSYFWQRIPLWPELAGLYFNVFEGKSQEWGVSPMHTYFTEYLRKLLLSSLPLALFACVRDGMVMNAVQPWLMYIGLISFLGHKEWRFVVYAVPVFNVAAARGAQIIVNFRGRSVYRTILRLIILGLFLLNVTVTTAFTYFSRLNYPGGHALLTLHNITHTNGIANIYVDDLAAQTGASLFTQLYGEPARVMPCHEPPWRYNKTETIMDFGPFTHIITERPAELPQNWKEVGQVRAFSRVEVPRSIHWHAWKEMLPRVVIEDRLWIMQQLQDQ